MQKFIRLSFLLFVVTLSALHPRTGVAEERAKTYVLRGRRAPGQVARVEAALEVSGDQKVMENGKPKRIKMSVLANMAYDERLLEVPLSPGDPVRSIRHYGKVAALLKVDREEIRPVLSEQRRLIGAKVEGETVTFFSPRGPLTRDELDLVEMHGSSLSLLAYSLLPQNPVAVGESWKHPADVLVALLDLDAASTVNVQSVLSAVSNGTAQVELSGQVAGAVAGVATNIALKAKYHFDLAREQITWFGLLIGENRAIGHVGPGLEAISRLQMKISPLEKSEHLSDTALAGLPLEPSDELTRLSYQSPQGGWQFLHDRDWDIFSDEERLAILRLIDRGEFVAQCKIHTLTKDGTNDRITLAEFQDDIKHGLGKTFGQFLQASQRSNEADYRIYKVVVGGEVEELPIRWIYCLVTDKEGHQVVFAFTVEESLLERFGQADQQLLDTLRLTDPAEG